MSQQKTKKSPSLWYQCGKCESYFLHKDCETHQNSCPPDLKSLKHPLVLDQVLYGTLDLKTNEEVKNVSSREKDGLVFVSQAAMQLCQFPIGEFVVIETVNRNLLVQRIWPTNEKSLTSVLLTRNCLEKSNFTQNDMVSVRLFDDKCSLKAVEVFVVLLSGPKTLELTSELSNRLSKSYESRYIVVGNVVDVMFYGTRLKFEIQAVSHKSDSLEHHMEKLTLAETNQFYLIEPHTKWKIFKSSESFIKATSKKYQIGGLDDEIKEIREMLKAVLTSRKISQLAQIKSVVLHGNSGTGKTSLAKMLAEECQANTICISPSVIYSSQGVAPEEVIKELFQNAFNKTPSIVILDEFDVLCPSRNGRLSDSEKRIISVILTYLDTLTQLNSKVFIIATTNKIDNVDQAFRRSGRLDREIEISTPSPKARKLILQKLLEGVTHELCESELQELSMITHGFVGSDLVSLCSEASLECSKKNTDTVNFSNFKVALRKVRPSAMREVQIEIPNVKWSDIGGQDRLKLTLKQAVEWPLKHPDCFTRLGVTPPKGVLMFGPPGCSKTMIAKALATESGLNFLSIKGPELFSKWVGESEKAIREVFRKARQVAPSIVFFDEIDALGGERGYGSSTSVQERVLAQLLTELDGITPLADVTILAATNRPDRIDKALLRPGRLDRIVYVPLPDEATRKEIFRIKLSKIPVTRDVDIEALVCKTLGYSGAEVNAVCHEAAMFALEDSLESEWVEGRHFEKALAMITPRTPQSLLHVYDEYINIKI